MRHFCPSCGKDFEDEFSRCPACGYDIEGYWSKLDYVDKLILALNHPEPSTPLRAASILGELQDPRAVDTLIAIVRSPNDIYLVREAIRALAKIGTPEAMAFLVTLADHQIKMVRLLVRSLLAQKEPDFEKGEK